MAGLMYTEYVITYSISVTTGEALSVSTRMQSGSPCFYLHFSQALGSCLWEEQTVSDSSMGSGGLPFPLSARIRALQACCLLVLTIHFNDHHFSYAEEQKQGENSIEFLSMFSSED